MPGIAWVRLRKIKFCDPARWAKILEKHPGLRICFGHFGGDEQPVREFIRSRAMAETGVNMVEPVNLDAAIADAGEEAADAAQYQAHVVSIVRGDAPYVETADGERYSVGDAIPGWGELISIGAHAHVLRPDGALAKLRPSPAPSVEAEPPPADASADAAVPEAPAAARRGDLVQQPEIRSGLRANVLDADTL